MQQHQQPRQLQIEEETKVWADCSKDARKKMQTDHEICVALQRRLRSSWRRTTTRINTVDRTLKTVKPELCARGCRRVEAKRARNGAKSCGDMSGGIVVRIIHIEIHSQSTIRRVDGALCVLGAHARSLTLELQKRLSTLSLARKPHILFSVLIREIRNNLIKAK